MAMEIFHIIISIMIIIISFIVIIHKNLKISTYTITIFGLILGIEFFLLQAYIVAITIIALLSCITTILLIKTINITENKEEET